MGSTSQAQHTSKQEKASCGFNKEKILHLLCKCFLLAISLSFLLAAIGDPYLFHEIDSYMLPTVSIEYRGSIVMTQEDIDRAREDYPTLYEEVYDYDTLRSAKLNKCSDTEWISFYFPVYSLVCLPAKLVLQLFHAEQARAFPITNALLLIVTLIFVYRRLRVPTFGKLAAVLLLGISPIRHYIAYISAEAMLFSLITVALVLYQNKNYKLAAFLIAVASMPNPTVMGIGIVMVVDYLVRLFRNRNTVKPFSKAAILETVRYGYCYLPCLVPFVFNFIMMRTGNPTAGGATLSMYGQRVLSYLFDLNFGFPSFAPVTLLAFFLLLVVSIVKKRYHAMVYAGFFFAPILAYSLMEFINCIAIFCSRYVMWTYPALALGVVVLAEQINVKAWARYASTAALTLTTACLLVVNNFDVTTFQFNTTARFFLDHFPSVYSPYAGTFYNRNDGYNLSHLAETPSYYFSTEQNYLTKLLFKSTSAYKQQIKTELYGDADSEQFLRNALDQIPEDGEFHYININPRGKIKLEKKNIEQLGIVSERKVVFASDDAIQISGADDAACSDTITFLTEPCALYKVEMEFDPSAKPKERDGITINFNDVTSVASDFINARENAYTVFLNAKKDGESKLQFFVKGDAPVTLQHLKITAMQSEKRVLDIKTPISISGNSEQDSAAFDFAAESFTDYKVTVCVKDSQQFDDEEQLFFRLDYQSDYTPYKPKVALRDGENTFIINASDLTLAKSPVQVQITGETAEPVLIESITVEQASGNKREQFH